MCERAIGRILHSDLLPVDLQKMMQAYLNANKPEKAVAFFEETLQMKLRVTEMTARAYVAALSDLKRFADAKEKFSDFIGSPEAKFVGWKACLELFRLRIAAGETSEATEALASASIKPNVPPFLTSFQCGDRD